MQLVCVREGRHRYHIGDIVDIPDDTDAFESEHFALLLTPSGADETAKKQAELEEIDKLNAQLAAAEADNAEADNKE